MVAPLTPEGTAGVLTFRSHPSPYRLAQSWISKSLELDSHPVRKGVRSLISRSLRIEGPLCGVKQVIRIQDGFMDPAELWTQSNVANRIRKIDSCLVRVEGLTYSNQALRRTLSTRKCGNKDRCGG